MCLNIRKFLIPYVTKVPNSQTPTPGHLFLHDCQSPVGQSATGPQRKPSPWGQGKAATASNSTQARAAVLMRTCDPVTGSNTGMRAKSRKDNSMDWTVLRYMLPTVILIIS